MWKADFLFCNDYNRTQFLVCTYLSAFLLKLHLLLAVIIHFQIEVDCSVLELVD